MTGNKVKARMYFTGIVLPLHMDQQVLAYKRWMKEHYGCNVGLKSPAHITIAPPFWMPEKQERALKQDVKTVAEKVAAFTLTTNNFSAFKARTIFVAVQENKALQALKDESDCHFRHTGYKMQVENRPFHPHITIATRDLNKKDFTEAWPHFQQRTFCETFLATGLSLLKHNGRTWEVVYSALFRLPENA